jgi:hypothetical protein
MERGDVAPRNSHMVRAGTDRAIRGRVMARSFDTTQNTARHEIFWTVPARHEHEGRVVPRISARRATWPGPYLGPCLGRHGTKMARRHFYNYTI